MSGSYVKVPGYQPDEKCPSVVWLELAQLEKLKARVEKAIEDAKRKATELDGMSPGTKVNLSKPYKGMLTGTRGLVVNRTVIDDNAFQPDDYVPVVFQGRGLVWTPVRYLFNENHYCVGYGQ